MSTRKTSWLNRMAALEACAVFLLILWYIWRLRFQHRYAWVLILALVALSQAARRETLAGLGFRWRTFGRSLRLYGPALVLLTAGIVALGLFSGTVRRLPRTDAVLGVFYYCFWGLFQQYLLNGYFVNRLEEAFPGRAPAPAAALFAAAHYPNWFLMIVTFAGGYVSAKIYLKSRNLYFLGLAHGVAAFALFLVTPDWISHHFYVGPRWFGH